MHVKHNKAKSCEQFISALPGVSNKKITHNIASGKWDTVKNGKGQNLLGNLLMELHEELTS